MTDPVENSQEKTTLAVVGLNCESCVKHTEEALRSVAGIKKATVSLSSMNADIEYDPGTVDLQTAKKAVQDAGYDLILP
ncbi:MAG TPA: copper chaperone [Actinobacteria bacterium]|nr:copper chaperone [Actinomycetota bacterium]